MKINGISLLYDYIRQYPRTKKWIETWVAEVKASTWSTPQDIKSRYASCSFLASNVVIFNVCGNNFRLEVVVAYKNGLVYVRWIGTHAEYTRRHKAQT